MTGVSDYAQRVPYYRRRYEGRRQHYIDNGKTYRRRNREAIKVARGLGVSIKAARRLQKQESKKSSKKSSSMITEQDRR